MSVVCALCPNCNVWNTLGPTIGIWHASGNEWDDAFDELCVTCIMLKVTAAKVNRLATASGLGVVWDFVRGHYAREAQEIAKREARNASGISLLSLARGAQIPSTITTHPTPTSIDVLADDGGGWGLRNPRGQTYCTLSLIRNGHKLMSKLTVGPHASNLTIAASSPTLTASSPTLVASSPRECLAAFACRAVRVG